MAELDGESGQLNPEPMASHSAPTLPGLNRLPFDLFQGHIPFETSVNPHWGPKVRSPIWVGSIREDGFLQRVRKLTFKVGTSLVKEREECFR